MPDNYRRYVSEQDVITRINNINAQSVGADPAGTANVKANEALTSAKAYADTKAPMYTYGTEDMEAGVTPLTTGKMHLVVE